MASYEKTLKSWGTKTEEKWTTVEAVLKQEGFILTNIDGSHFNYRHPILTEMVKMFSGLHIPNDYGPAGQIIVIKHGNKANGYILRRILKAIETIRKFEKLPL